jgi:hypothetical protein
MITAVAGVVAATVTTAGCGQAPTPSSSTSAASTVTRTSTATPASTTGASPTPPSAATTSGTSNGQNYAVTTTKIEGSTDDRQGNWRMEFGELSGGDPAVVEAFNGASHAAAMDQVEAAKEGTEPGAQWNFESNGQVTFRSIAVAQVVFGSLYYGAHPSHQVGTIVIDSRSADPIMLTDLFSDPQAGLNRLAEQTRTLLAADGLEVSPDEPGAAPKAENFANWIPTADGLEFHFNEYQFGPRLPAVVTVPWAQLSDVLAPAMADLAKG